MCVNCVKTIRMEGESNFQNWKISIKTILLARDRYRRMEQSLPMGLRFSSVGSSDRDMGGVVVEMC